MAKTITTSNTEQQSNKVDTAGDVVNTTDISRNSAADTSPTPTMTNHEAGDRDSSDESPSTVRDSSGDTEYGDSLLDNWKESSKVGTIGGTVVGAASGAAMGSLGGPIGAVIGGVTGAISGAGVGALADGECEGIEDETSRRANEIDTRSPTYQSAISMSGPTREQPYVESDSSAPMSDTEHDQSARANWEESRKGHTTGGTIAGAGTGAAIGAAGGPVGAVVGGVIGAATGAAAGAASDAAGEAAKKHTYGSWNDYENDFRSDYDTQYAANGAPWDHYALAYRYGYDVAVDPRYQGREWNDIEHTLQRGWDENGTGPWDSIKDAVRYAWERTTNTRT